MSHESFEANTEREINISILHDRKPQNVKGKICRPHGGVSGRGSMEKMEKAGVLQLYPEDHFWDTELKGEHLLPKVTCFLSSETGA